MSGTVRAHRLTRRAAVIGLGLGGLSAALAARGISALAAQDDTPTATTPAPFTGVTFVGEASDPRQDGEPNPLPDEALPFVAVVVADEEEGADHRQARAYLCDGMSISEWFNQGSVEGEAIDLTSASGARFEGELTDEAVTGTVELTDGRSFAFAAELATGIAGLYNVTISADGQIRGSSEAGGRIEGEVLADEPAEDDLFPLTVTVTAPESESHKLDMRLQVLAPNMSGPTEERFVVLADARMKGGPREGTGPKGFRVICIDF